jgi:hypothetical protein
MAGSSLLEYERDVEQCRVQLTRDLGVLCSPETFAKFTDDLKQETFETKDALWDDVKARAAANPAALIAIGTGLAWKLIQRPPIASALISVGLYSLWKTEAKRTVDGTRPDYLQQSKQALKEQAGEVVSAASRIAGQAQEAVAAKGAEIWDGAREKVRAWSEDWALGSTTRLQGQDRPDSRLWTTSVPSSTTCGSRWRMSRPWRSKNLVTRTPETICCLASPAWQ